MSFASEADVADLVISYLKSCGLVVYTEVPVGASRIDIVGVGEHHMVGVEVKKRGSFEVFDQAIQRRGYFHQMFVAFPFPKSNRRGFASWRAICDAHRIGVLQVQPQSVIEWIPSGFLRRVFGNIRAGLSEHQIDQRAGVNGGYWSPFVQTRRLLIRYVTDNGPCRLKDAIGGIKHHYASSSTALSSIRRWIREGVIEELVLENGKVRLASASGER